MTSLLKIPAGEFWMGAREPGPLFNESPRHRVWVPAFEFGACAVTVEEYAEFLEATGHPAPRGWQTAGLDHPRQPAAGVSWLDAMEYCEWLGRRLGRRIHLPTEAQREWAARGGGESEYPWGDAPLARTGPLPGPDRVGEDAPNGFGLHNMGDGVHEWCADWYDAGYYTVSPEVNPRGAPNGDRRSARGGSWRHAVPFSRSAARSALDPTKRFTDFGFRIAASAAFDYVP